MPTTFRKSLTFKAKPETRLDEFGFDGGLVVDQHETKLQPNQSPNMANALFSGNKSILTRKGYTRYNTTPVGIASDTANSGASTGTLAITTSATYVAQTFQASGAIKTIQVDLSLAMNTTGETQLMRAELWATSGAPTAILTTASKSQIKLISGTSQTTYSFIFRTPISFSASTSYAIVLKPFLVGNGTTVNQVNVYHRGSTYANGQVYTSSSSGSSWSGDSAKDLIFTVYSGGDTGGSGLYRFYGAGGVKQLLTKIGSSLYRGDDGAGTLTAITLGSGVSLTAGNFLDWTVANGTLLVVDGDNNIQKYRGSTNSNYTTGTITVTNDSKIVLGSSTVWATSTNAETGEYIKLPDGKWYKITGITDDTHLSIEVNYQGTTSAGATYTISPWGEVQGKLSSGSAPGGLVHPTPKYIENHINRIWTLDGNELRFSALDTSITEEHFNDWDTSNNAGEIIIPSGRGDAGTGLYSLNGALYIFQRRAIWRLYGNSPANFELRNVTNEIGMIDRRTLIEWNDVLIFLSDSGVIMFDGSNVKNLTENIIATDIASWANSSSPSAGLWQNKYILSYTPSGTAYNSEAVYFDLQRSIWGKMTNVFASAWNTWAGATDDNELYFVSSTQGSVFRWDIGGNDDGYEIYTLYDTPSYGFNAGVNDKTVKKVYLQQLAKGNYNMSVSMLADINVTTTSTTIDLSTGTESLWDAFTWDSSSWSSEEEIITTRIAEFQGIAKYFKFRFEHTGYDQGIEILVLTVTERTRRLR